MSSVWCQVIKMTYGEKWGECIEEKIRTERFNERKVVASCDIISEHTISILALVISLPCYNH